jgi:tRNA threonylcarbamoyl adenosine modification protein YjeE
VQKNSLGSWKKVYEVDVPYICSEIKDLLTLPALVVLSGEMGSGKTTLISLYLHEFYHRNDIQSPTYALINDYGDILHADFDRIKEQAELDELDLHFVSENKKIFFVEWGEKYLSYLNHHLAEELNFFQLIIEKNNESQQSPNDQQSRNYHLYSLTR